MQTNPVGTTWTLGNHALTDAEVAAGAPQRKPFYGEDDLPADPDEVELQVTDPDRIVSFYRWPAAGPGDAGVLTKQETGRFYVYVTPQAGQDGTWTWKLKGAMVLGTGASDRDAFYVGP